MVRGLCLYILLLALYTSQSASVARSSISAEEFVGGDQPAWKRWPGKGRINKGSDASSGDGMGEEFFALPSGNHEAVAKTARSGDDWKSWTKPRIIEVPIAKCSFAGLAKRTL
jgi:hypothetical protein